MLDTIYHSGSMHDAKLRMRQGRPILLSTKRSQERSATDAKNTAYDQYADQAGDHVGVESAVVVWLRPQDRPNISASADERDVFGAQQQSAIERLTIPLYVEALAKASAF